MKISLCMIVKNEEAVLGRCLESVYQLVDEIIIVDTGSTDGTKSIALQYTDKVYDFEWIDNFSAARNFAFSKGKYDFLMWLDADDVIDRENAVEFIKMKQSLTKDISAVMLLYNTGFDENGKAVFSYYRERLLNRSCNFKWEGAVHEVIATYGNVIKVPVAITHKKPETAVYTTRNLDIYKKMIEKNTTLSPRNQYYYGRELFYHNLYDEAVNILSVFISNGMGFVENIIDACLILSKCYSSLNKHTESIRILFESFLYEAPPRGEICCAIGERFIALDKYKEAIYWYNTALESSYQEKLKSGGFVQIDYYGFIPLIQLCVCYDKIGNTKKAKECNEMAGKIKPYNESYLHNKKYFENISKKIEE